MRITRTTIAPTWLVREATLPGEPVKPMRGERRIGTAVTVGNLTITFDSRHEPYKTLIAEKRLILKIEEERLVILAEPMKEGVPEELTWTGIDKSGLLLEQDGSLLTDQAININTPRRLTAEQVFPELIKALAARLTEEVKVADFWSPAELGKRETFGTFDCGSYLTIDLAADSLFLGNVRGGDLQVLTKPNRFFEVRCGRDLLGVLQVTKSGAKIDLGREVPAINFGPTLAAYIGQNLDKVLTHEPEAANRSLKPLILFTAGYFSNTAMIMDSQKATRVIDLVLQGCEQVCRGIWFSGSQKQTLIAEARMALSLAEQHPGFRIMLAQRLADAQRQLAAY